MPQSDMERKAKRAMRVVGSLETMEKKGRTKEPAYKKLIAEIKAIAPGLVKEYDEAKAELHQVRTAAIFERRRIEKAQAKLKQDQEAFHKEKHDLEKKRKLEVAEARRLRAEVQKERRELALEQADAEEARRKYHKAMEKLKEIMGSV